MTVLDDILVGVRQDVRIREEQTPFMDLVDHIPEMPPALSVVDRLRLPGCVPVIGEIKRSSPYSGDLAAIENPGELAQQYQAGGASAVSVFTEPRHFKGSLADLNAVKQAVTIPVLRKDFIVSPYQIYESRAYGADMLALVVSALPGSQLVSFMEITEQLGMTAMVSVHTADEVHWALQAGVQVLGINARDPKTNTVNRADFVELAKLVPQDVIVVAEFAVGVPDDVPLYHQAGADAILVGKALVTAPNPQQVVAELVAAGRIED